MSMKIAIMGPAPPYRGGISLFALMLARAFKELGHEALFINFEVQYPALLFPGKGQLDKSLNASEFANHRIIIPWLPSSWNQTIHLLLREKPDVIIVSWFLPFFAPAYGYILRKLPKMPKVILAHNISAHEKWALADKLMQYAFEPASKIVVLSKSTLAELHKKVPLFISRRGVLGFHPCYDCYVQNVGNPKKGNVLLFFGLIKPYKGLDVLLEAMPLILKSVPDTKLVVAGEVYGNVSVYLQQIQELGIANAVETHFRYISDPEIAHFFNQASLCVLPYKTASQSGVIATSYSFGVPVLATRVGGLGEYVLDGETGYLVPPLNKQKMAETIINHLQTKPDFSQAIDTYTRLYSWKALAELMIAP